MPLSDTIRKLINNAWDDGYPCTVATTGKDGPNISVKGSMIVFDDKHLAYWERSKKKALENLAQDRRVVVMYSNFKAQRDKVLDSGFLRFWAWPNCTSPARCTMRSFRSSTSASR